MTKLINKTSRKLSVSDDDATTALNREIIPLLGLLRDRLNDILATTDLTQVLDNTEITYDWHASRYGSLFINQIAGATLAIDISDDMAVASFVEGHRINVVIRNATGAPMTISWSSDFSANGAIIVDGETATWLFQVGPLGWPTGRIVQVGDVAVV